MPKSVPGLVYLQAPPSPPPPQPKTPIDSEEVSHSFYSSHFSLQAARHSGGCLVVYLRRHEIA